MAGEEGSGDSCGRSSSRPVDVNLSFTARPHVKPRNRYLNQPYIVCAPGAALCVCKLRESSSSLRFEVELEGGRDENVALEKEGLTSARGSRHLRPGCDIQHISLCSFVFPHGGKSPQETRTSIQLFPLFGSPRPLTLMAQWLTSEID